MIVLGAHLHALDHARGTVPLTVPLGIRQGPGEVRIAERIGWGAHGALLIFRRIRRRLDNVHVLHEICGGGCFLLNIRLQSSDGQLVRISEYNWLDLISGLIERITYLVDRLTVILGVHIIIARLRFTLRFVLPADHEPGHQGSVQYQQNHGC